MRNQYCNQMIYMAILIPVENFFSSKHFLINFIYLNEQNTQISLNDFHWFVDLERTVSTTIIAREIFR